MTDKEKVENPSEEEMSDSEEGVTVYELAFHLLPTLSEDEVTNEIAGFKALLQKEGATLISEEAPRSMELAYTMVKKQEGKNAKFDTSFFGFIKFEAQPASIEILKEEIDLSKNVLRYFVIKTVREYEPLQHKELYKQVEEDTKPISKPVVKEVKKEDAQPLSEKELDKTIEDLVAD